MLRTLLFEHRLLRHKIYGAMSVPKLMFFHTGAIKTIESLSKTDVSLMPLQLSTDKLKYSYAVTISLIFLILSLK
jgi:hypothetical protein